MNPDLIITGNKDSYNVLSKIALTIVCRGQRWSACVPRIRLRGRFGRCSALRFHQKAGGTFFLRDGL
ncbi:hypothetical protein [Paenibacillus oceani]|uniref:Uncharacterized protein n=1 Tax=Paenibacillus oceani TaxID=2772510 RepID=A0A927C5J8_9BACL|nr:hypothetical protein [Paenibacillus oceani]MBD2860407.1 hypothetical protein [Paenibacillus oceani]